MKIKLLKRLRKRADEIIYIESLRNELFVVHCFGDRLSMPSKTHLNRIKAIKYMNECKRNFVLFEVLKIRIREKVL